jgi:hypothetical protein
MVVGQESSGRLAALDAEQAELHTRAAVLEEQARATRANTEREREALRAQAVACLAEEGDASTRAAVKVRARGDAAVAQHGEAVQSFMASQEVGVVRL